MAEQHEAETAAAQVEAAPSRALTAVAPAGNWRGEERPSAGFLAQLIACDRRVPAYRAARNAEPARAVSAYAGQPGWAAPRVDCLI